MARSDELDALGDSPREIEGEAVRSDSTTEDEADTSSDKEAVRVSSPLEGVFNSLAHSLVKVRLKYSGLRSFSPLLNGTTFTCFDSGVKCHHPSSHVTSHMTCHMTILMTMSRRSSSAWLTSSWHTGLLAGPQMGRDLLPWSLNSSRNLLFS